MSPHHSHHSPKLFDMNVQYIHQTNKAILYDNGTEKFWVPKSILGEHGLVQAEDNADGSITLTAPEWWFQDRELI